MKGHERVPRHERLVDALADDILGAADADVLATHAGGAARVVADSLRQALHRAIGAAVQPVEGARDILEGRPVRPDRDDEERR